jgi:hypothetical protein
MFVGYASVSQCGNRVYKLEADTEMLKIHLNLKQRLINNVASCN